MDSLIPRRDPPLKRYFMAASVEEALAYLSAHRGEAQVVGGGTSLMPVVLRGESVARHLVDVSRIAGLRRIRIERDYLILGGSVTLAQLLRSETALNALPVLGEMASSTDTPRLRELSTLAGHIVSARGNNSVSTTLIALNSEAEIANLTGSQWLPVRSLLVRPGSCRVNSMSEVLVSLRIPLLEPGSGAALIGADRSGGSEHPAVAAAALGFDGARNLISSLCLVVGVPGTLPQTGRLSDITDERSPAVETVRRAVHQWAVSLTPGSPAGEAATRPETLASAAQRAFDTALERARASLSNSMP